MSMENSGCGKLSRAAIQSSITTRMENRHPNKNLYTNAHIGTIFCLFAFWPRGAACGDLSSMTRD